MKIEENEIYTTKEVAEILKISLPTIKRMLKDGRLPSTRIGRQHRFLGKDLLDIMRNQQVAGAPSAGAAAGPETPEYVQATPYQTPKADAERVPPELRRRSYMLGKRLRSDLLGDDGAVIFTKGTIITEETIKEAGLRHKMMELFSNLE